MLEDQMKETAEKMKKALDVVEHNLGALRTGQASVRLLDGVMVQIYGGSSPINQVATLSTPDAATILIQPWDKGALASIEKAVLQANLGLTPNNDGKLIRLNVPPLTEQNRKEMVKRAHAIAEEGRISVRNTRRQTNDVIKKTEKSHDISEDDAKRLTQEVQKKTDEAIKQIDHHLELKEKEVMTV